MRSVLKKWFTIGICICMCLQLLQVPMLVVASEKELVEADIDSDFLSKDLFDIGYCFFKPEVIRENNKLTVYFRQLGNIKYNGVMIYPEEEILASTDDGPDWDGYTLPYTEGKNTYTFRVYSRVMTSFYWNITLTMAEDGTIIEDTNDGEDDDINNEETLKDGTYEIPVSFIQEASSAASMLDQYTYSTAELTITGDVYMLTLYINHWYEESSGTQAVEYIEYQGVRATKVSGAKTIDGTLYDTFTIQLKDLSETQAMTAQVIPMEQISAGFGAQKVRLVMDLSGIEGIPSTGTNSSAADTLRAQLGTLLEATALLSKGSYTSASWSALQSAITTAKTYYSNTSATQVQLQAQITAVEEAIAGLVQSSSTTSAGLEDGTYTINVSAIKATSTDTSMANQYLKKTADLEVDDDTYKLTVYFKADEMNYLKYNGSKATKTSGSSYDGFTFTLANTEEYQTITVSVKQMEEINASLSVQSCRLVLDWDSVVSGSSSSSDETIVATVATDVATLEAADTLTANTVTQQNTSSGGYRSTSSKQASTVDLADTQTPLAGETTKQSTVAATPTTKHLLQKASNTGVWVAGASSGLMGLLSAGLGIATGILRYKRKYQR